VTEQPFDEALRERALAVLSAMVLWMKDNKQGMGIIQEMFPVHLKGPTGGKLRYDLIRSI
jgi:hypothetical protein